MNIKKKEKKNSAVGCGLWPVELYCEPSIKEIREWSEDMFYRLKLMKKRKEYS
jgi:hypothetical protein